MDPAAATPRTVIATIALLGMGSLGVFALKLHDLWRWHVHSEPRR